MEHRAKSEGTSKLKYLPFQLGIKITKLHQHHLGSRTTTRSHMVPSNLTKAWCFRSKAQRTSHFSNPFASSGPRNLRLIQIIEFRLASKNKPPTTHRIKQLLARSNMIGYVMVCHNCRVMEFIIMLFFHLYLYYYIKYLNGGPT